MRILHTSDWHLGASLHGASRDEEHARFLDWLRGELKREPVDALVVAGDVYEYLQPSAEAQRLLYAFLAAVAADGTAGRVVLVGGNHDSASRLDAPAAVLEPLRTSVVGGYERDDEARCLVPVEIDGGVPLVVVAVPFVREFRLGVRALGIESGALHAQICEAFTALYTRLADAAKERWPDARLVATGHMTCVGASEDDYRTPLHHIGSIDALPDGVFDPRYDYVALGHIHRMFPIGAARRAWYSGTPIALTSTELDVPRRVLRVELDGEGGRKVTPVTVPVFRRVVSARGTLAEVEQVLAGVRVAPDELVPYVMAEVIESERTPMLVEHLRGVLEQASPERAAALVHVSQRRPASEREDDARETPSLREMTPTQVFSHAWALEHGGDAPPEEIVRAFRTLLVADEEAGA